MSKASIQNVEGVGPNTPLRLGVAAALAFPDGSMTASGLRRERDRGRLVVERIAGRDYTTLGYIERMRELCRAADRDRASGLEKPSATVPEDSHIRPSGLSKTLNIGKALDAAKQIVEGLKERSLSTSPANTSPGSKPASVHRLQSRSRTSSRSTGAT
jgi:hypothetical protein